MKALSDIKEHDEVLEIIGKILREDPKLFLLCCHLSCLVIKVDAASSNERIESESGPSLGEGDTGVRPGPKNIRGPIFFFGV